MLNARLRSIVRPWGPFFLGLLLIGLLGSAFHHHAGGGDDPGCAVCSLAHAPASTPPATPCAVPQILIVRPEPILVDVPRQSSLAHTPETRGPPQS
jgi:hypothetical protein